MSYKLFLDSITNQVLTMKPFSSDILNVQLSVSLIGLFTLQKWPDLETWGRIFQKPGTIVGFMKELIKN
jgi:hypothetical protein